MKRIIIGLLLLFPLLVKSQTKNINWVKDLTFEQVKQKAKKENKYILLDCFTTWCGPCKEMDANVYPVDSVVAFINNHFIAVRVQFDKTNHDDPITKLWYKTIPTIEARYIVDGYPTFIYLKPNGDLAYQQSGFSSISNFMKEMRLAVSPTNNYKDWAKAYINLKGKYKKGNVVSDSLFYLLSYQTRSKLLANDSIYRPVWNKLYRSYLEKSKPSIRYTIDNIWYWEYLDLPIDDPILKYFLTDGALIDSVKKQKGFAASIVARSINNHIAIPFFQEQNKGIAFTGTFFSGVNADYAEVDWKELERRITRQFDEKVAKRYLPFAKLVWYSRHSNGEGTFKTWLEQLTNNPEDLYNDWFAINNVTCKVFNVSTDRHKLEQACRLMQEIIVNYLYNWPDGIDTYASLLYKTGRTAEAIRWEEKASNVEGADPSFKTVVRLMKESRPIYAESTNWEGFDHINWNGFEFKKLFLITANDETLENAVVINNRSKDQKETNKKGVVNITVMLGDKLEVNKSGYETQEFMVNKSGNYIIHLIPMAR